MIDLVALKDLPLPLAVIIIAFYLINTNNAEFAKKLAAIIAEFTGKYEAVIETMAEERQEARARWIERDRVLTERLEKNTEAHVRNANETHQLRTLVTPLVLNTEAERKRRPGGAQGRTGDGD